MRFISGNTDQAAFWGLVTGMMLQLLMAGRAKQ